MTQTTAGEGDFEVIHLKTASAAEAAKLLDRRSTKTKPAAQRNRARFWRLFPTLRRGGNAHAARQPDAEPHPHRRRPDH